MTNSKNKSGIVAAIAIVLVFVLLIGALGYLSDGFKNWNADTWFNKNNEKAVQTEDNFVFDGDGKVMDSGKVHAMPKNMLFSADITPMSIPSVTLQATVKPDSLKDKSVDWSVSWLNPSSEWATGKTVKDYLTVIPQSDGSTTAEVSCLQAFGEQIKIVVNSRINLSATAECTVDYASRITEAGIDFYSINPAAVPGPYYTIPQSASEYIHSSDYFIKLIPPQYVFDSPRLELSPGYSAYTVQDNFTVKFYLTYSQEYMNALEAQGIALKANAAEEHEIENLYNGACFANPIFESLDLSVLYISLTEEPTDIEPYEKILAATNAIGTDSAGTLKVVATGQYSTFTRSVDITLNLSKLADLLDYFYVTVALDNGTLVI